MPIASIGVISGFEYNYPYVTCQGRDQVRLTDEEKAVLDGCEGEARAHAMDLLLRYGTALGAEKLVDTNNVCGGVVGSLPGPQGCFAGRQEDGYGCRFFPAEPGQ